MPITNWTTTIREHNQVGDAGWMMSTVVIAPESHVAVPMHATPNTPWWVRIIGEAGLAEREPGMRAHLMPAHLAPSHTLAARKRRARANAQMARALAPGQPAIRRRPRKGVAG